jgi:hypothetical protein
VTNRNCKVNVSTFQAELKLFSFLEFFKGLFKVRVCRAASGVELTVPVIDLRAWFYITSNVFRTTGVAVISALRQVLYVLHILHSMDHEISNLLPTSLFRIFISPPVFSAWFLHVRFVYTLNNFHDFVQMDSD